jgi:uncharacterized protein YjbI with pentapeptide repeats
VPNLDRPVREPFDGPLEPEGDYDLQVLANVDLTEQNAQRSRFVECALTGCLLDETRLDRSHLIDTEITAARAGSVHLRDSTWRGTTWHECRLGALLATGVHADDITIEGGKIDYLTFAGARLNTVRLTGVTIGELDLSDAQVKSLTASDTQVDKLVARGATMRDTDLRGVELGSVDGIAGLSGATISEDQAMLLSVATARELGIRVV